MPGARVFGPWPEHSNPAASCLQWSCALQAEAVDTSFFFACAHLTRGRCCTSNLIAPLPWPPCRSEPPPQVSYLNDKDTRARYSTTLPSSTLMSSLQTSATRKSRSEFAAISTAFFAASSQEFGLVPMISVTL